MSHGKVLSDIVLVTFHIYPTRQRVPIINKYRDEGRFIVFHAFFSRRAADGNLITSAGAGAATRFGSFSPRAEKKKKQLDTFEIRLALCARRDRYITVLSSRYCARPRKDVVNRYEPDAPTKKINK